MSLLIWFLADHQWSPEWNMAACPKTFRSDRGANTCPFSTHCYDENLYTRPPAYGVSNHGPFDEVCLGVYEPPQAGGPGAVP